MFLSLIQVSHNIFCDKCKNLNNHKLINIRSDKTIDDKFTILNSSKWFLKLKNDGFVNLMNHGESCPTENMNISEIINNFIDNIENTEKKKLDEISYEIKNDLKINSTKIAYLNSKVSNYLLEIRIGNLEEEMNNLKLSLKIIFEEFSKKNKIVQFIRTRNILQHLLFNIIKKNYKCFEKIEGDFRILYESYKYLNHEKKNNEAIKEKLESIFEGFENLIKNQIKKNVKSHIIHKIMEDKNIKDSKMEKETIEKIFNSTANYKKNFEKLIKKIVPKIDDSEKLRIYNNLFAQT